MKSVIAHAALFIAITSAGHTAGPPEQNIREAYKMIISQGDANKDGKLSVTECIALYTECMALYKDKSIASFRPIYAQG
jgi:hypothetical protein